MLNLLNQSLIKSKHVMLQGNALAESGAQIAYQAFFNDFCLSVFRSSFAGNEDVWKMTLYIIKEIVDLDPAYLATFLVSSACTELSNLFNDSGKSWFGLSVAAIEPPRLSSILVPICKLAQAVCITAEGRLLVGKSKMLEFVLKAVTGDLNLTTPVSILTGVAMESTLLSAEKLHKIGKTMSQVLLECEAVRVPVKTLLREKMLSLCREAHASHPAVYGDVPLPVYVPNLLQQKKNINPQGWQRDGDHSVTRGQMVEEITQLLKSRRPIATTEWLEKLPHMAKRLEDCLFHEANTLADYNDRITLKSRLQQLAVSMSAPKPTIDVAVTPPRKDPPQPGDSARRLQVLQRLTNVCALIEGMFVENKTRHNSELMRDLLNEQVVEALMQTYGCTLPPSEQMFAQLSIRDAMVLGFFSGAKSITALLKFAAHNTSQNFIPIVCRQLEWTLSSIGQTRQTLFANKDKQRDGGDKKGDFEQARKIDNAIVEDPIMPMLNALGARRRGSSLGRSPSPPPATAAAAVSASTVFVLGLFDLIPHRSVLDPTLRSELNHNASDLQAHLSRFLNSVLTLEWLSILLTTALRSMKMLSGAGNSAILANRDVLRRLMAFHRSSVLEVCRLTSKTIFDKVLQPDYLLNSVNVCKKFMFFFVPANER